MNNSVQILRRLLTFRSCNKIVGWSYCDDRKSDKKSDGRESPLSDSSAPPQSQPQTNIDNLNLQASSGTRKVQQTSDGTAKDNQLSTAPEQGAGISQTSIPISGKDSSEDSKIPSKTAVTQMQGKESPSDSKSEDVDERRARIELDGFFAAYKKQEEIVKTKEKRIEPEKTFASMLRNSSFIDLGDPVGKVVTGEICHVVGNDLYIDFGWKFFTVCSKPRRNPENYVVGAKVNLRIKDLELSARFLGENEYISLHEADCELMGLTFKQESKAEM